MLHRVGGSTDGSGMTARPTGPLPITPESEPRTYRAYMPRDHPGAVGGDDPAGRGNRQARPVFGQEPGDAQLSSPLAAVTGDRQHGEVGGVWPRVMTPLRGSVRPCGRANGIISMPYICRVKVKASAQYLPAHRITLGVPYGNRTRVTNVKGWCPRPLDERDEAVPPANTPAGGGG